MSKLQRLLGNVISKVKNLSSLSSKRFLLNVNDAKLQKYKNFTLLLLHAYGGKHIKQGLS